MRRKGLDQYVSVDQYTDKKACHVHTQKSKKKIETPSTTHGMTNNRIYGIQVIHQVVFFQQMNP